MTRGALHLERPREDGHGLDEHVALCGSRSDRDALVAHPAEVTCKLCKRRVRALTLASAKRQAVALGAPRGGRIAAKAMLLAHAAEDAGDVEAEATAGWYVPPVGATRLDERARAIVERSFRDAREPAEDDKPAARWGSVRAALERAAGHLDEGASVSSSSAPSRFEGMPHGTREGRVSNVERGVDDVVGVLLAIERAYVGGMGWDGPPAVRLTGSLCREVLLWRLVGRPLEYRRKSRAAVRRVPVDTVQIIEMALAREGVALTEHQVSLVVRQGTREVREALERTGEMAAERKAVG